MSNKKSIYTFQGINQDFSRSKHLPQFYFEGQHIKLLTTDTQSSGSLANEKGNALVMTLPNITINVATNEIELDTLPNLSYTNGTEIDTQIASGDLPTSSTSQVIIGHSTTRDSIVLFSTDESMDCIWLLSGVLDGNYKLELLYLRNFGFTINNPIQAIFNYENSNIQKVYWIDGSQQIRFINLTYSSIEGNGALIDVPLNTFNFVGNVEFSQPTIPTTSGGGTHTAGMIQYAYNLFRLNGAQTKLSPLSPLIPLNKGVTLGGGALNEVVGTIPLINIKGLDQSYTHIKIYAIKYTSFGQVPSIDLIDEREVNSTEINVFDDGSTISSLSLSEFIFLGSNPTIPKHIESKDNRLFLANIQDNAFDIPDILDMRAYSFIINSTTTLIWDDPQLDNLGNVDPAANFTLVNSTYNIPPKHDSINLEFNNRRYQFDSSIEGGTGKYLKYELIQKTSGQLSKNPNTYRFLKDEEIYRIGIIFYNNLGQTSLPRWIADFKTPEGNLVGNFNTLKVTLLPTFTTFLNTFTFENPEDKPIGYKIIRADRTAADRTILCQGALTQMMCQTTRDTGEYEFWKVKTNRLEESDTLVKIPITVSRGFISNISPLIKTDHLRMMNEEGEGPYGNDPNTEFSLEEVYSTPSRNSKTQQSWQYSKMMQMNSPDVLFETGLGFSNGLKLKIKGLVKNTVDNIWYKRINTTSKVEELSQKESNLTTKFGITADMQFFGLFGPTTHEQGNPADQNLINRDYLTYIPATNRVNFDIFGAPEITGRGQGVVSYNGNSTLKYANTMEGFLTDPGNHDNEKAIVSMNSFGNRCLTLVEGSDSATLANRKTLEQIHTTMGVAELDGLVLAEVVIPETSIYLGNIYGGNSYEDKSRTSYIEIGNYNLITSLVTQIDNAGDTYVYNYRFARISKTDVELLDSQVLQFTEIINYPVETTIDLKNRNDKSLFEWDSEFQPRYGDYHDYNRVYSQSPNLVGIKSADFTFRRIKNFDTRIQATKLKIPNESIDSWTDILESEIMDLDGKYGAINGIVSFNDEIFSFQDEAIAKISINPKVQVQASDGITLELGEGGILYDYKYLTSKSGSINKWGIVSTKSGIFYYDALNKALGRVPDGIRAFLSDTKGLHAHFNNNFDYDLLKVDNPYLKSGALLGYDNYNNDIYITLLQGNKSFTRCFNEGIDQFIDLKTYQPSAYIYKGEKLLMLHPDNNKLYESYAGNYNSFFGVTHPSFVTLMLNPESSYTAVFDNIEFNSELYLNDIDQPDKTLTHIQAFNEYQDSGRIQLVNGRGSNLRRKFRKWKADIPRDKRSRIRNPWVFLKLELDNTSNYKFILHDILISYTI